MTLPPESSPLQMHVQNGQAGITTQENIEGQRTHLSSMQIWENA